jgi:hypothetical protein
MTDPTYRMSMLPFGTYPNDNGQGEHLGFAVPGMIQEPINALSNLFAHGNFAKGPDYPGNANDMRTLLFSMYGGNALNPASLAEHAGLRDAAQAAYRTARHPLESAVYDGPLPEVSSAHAAMPNPSSDGWFHGIDTPDYHGRTYLGSDTLGIDLPQSLLSRFANDPEGGFDPKYLDAVMSQGRRNDLSTITGGLLSDTGTPSLMGSALAPSGQRPRNSLLDY